MMQSRGAIGGSDGGEEAGAVSSFAGRRHRGRRVRAMLLPSSSSSYASKGDSFGKTVDDHMRSTLTFNNKQSVFASQNIDYGQPIACISYPYNDSSSGGVWAAYGSSAVVHSQIAGGGTSTTTRVPLPLKLAGDEPIYVNPKQYHGILRRRQLRAKLVAQNKLAKTRKPYLHESRHRHAMKRARGSGGRFLNTKQQQQSRAASTKATADGTNSSGLTRLRHCGGAAGDRTATASKTMASQENSKRGAASAPAFTVTPVVHKDDAFFQHHGHPLSFSGHFSQAGAQGNVVGATHNGAQQRVPAMR